MGYFSNGSEFDQYHAEFCSNCVHDENENCPIQLIHEVYSYELCNEIEHPGKIMLDALIPIKENGFCDKCTMFVQIKKD